MHRSRRGSHSARSSRPAPLDIEQAQASNSSATQSASEQTSGRRSARLGGEPVSQVPWGHDPQPRRGSVPRARGHQSNITSYFNSILSPRESDLPIYEERTGQTPTYTSATTAGNIPPPPRFPPRQSTESTSVPTAATASASERSQQPLELSSGPSSSENATPTPFSQQQEQSSQPAESGTSSTSAGEQQSPPGDPISRGSPNISPSSPSTSQQQPVESIESTSIPEQSQRSVSLETRSQSPAPEEEVTTSSTTAREQQSPPRDPISRESPNIPSSPSTSQQQPVESIESTSIPEQPQRSVSPETRSQPVTPGEENPISRESPNIPSSPSTPQQQPVESIESSSIPQQPQQPVSVETRSQPPSPGEETTDQLPNMSDQPSASPPLQALSPLQKVSMRWQEAPEEDRNKPPSQLSRDVLERVFHLAEKSLDFLHVEFRCGFCHQAMSDSVLTDGDSGYVRCSHAMHWDCIQRGGLDNGCPVCRTQSASFVSRPPESEEKDCIILDENEMECFVCRDRLTQSTQLAVLPCDHGFHRDCIEAGGLANGCPKCRNSVPTYGSWREVHIPSPTPSRAGTPPPPPSTGGTSPRGESAAMRNRDRDRLLSELFHIHPEIWHIFEEEKRRLQEIQNIANFDLDGWLNDFRANHTDPGSGMSSILMRWHFSDYNPDLDIQDPRVRDVGRDQRNTTFYNAIVTAVTSLMNGTTDESSARLAFHDANQSRSQDTSNVFHPNFWLPHERMCRRATTNNDQQKVRSHMVKYIRKFHNHPIMETLCRTLEPSGNATPQENGSQEQRSGDGTSGDASDTIPPTGQPPDGTIPSVGVNQPPDIPSTGPRLHTSRGWVYDGGAEKEIAGYRPYASGYQLLLQTPAPRGGYLDYELVAAHLLGGDAVVEGYKEYMTDRGEQPFLFEESSIDLLRTKTKAEITIAGRSVFRRYATPPSGGYLNAPMQHLRLKFSGEPGTYWYAKGTLERYHNRPWVESLLQSLYHESGISPLVFAPSETRERVTRRRRWNATTGTTGAQASPPHYATPPPGTSHTAPVSPTAAGPNNQPPHSNATPQPPYATPPPDTSNQPPPQATNPAGSGGSTVEERLSRLEAMIAELLNAQRGQNR